MANSRIAYGIAKGLGIDTTDMSPKEVWEAIAKKKGISVEEAKKQSDNNDNRKATVEKLRELTKLENEKGSKRSKFFEEEDKDIEVAKRKLVEYLKRFRNGENVEKEIDLMEVRPRTKKDLEELLNQEINAQTHSLHIDELRHMEKRHGEKGAANHDLANTEDYEKIIDVLNDYDGKPEFSRNDKGEIRYSKKYKNKDGTPTPQIIMRKKIGEEIRETVVTVSNSKNKGVKTITSYKNKE